MRWIDTARRWSGNAALVGVFALTCASGPRVNFAARFWMAVAVLVAAVIVWVRLYRHQRQLARRLRAADFLFCTQCLYPLGDSPRCPECGDESPRAYTQQTWRSWASRSILNEPVAGLRSTPRAPRA